MKTEDEIMASYLLTGGKMLSETCEDCGAPLFEIEGKQCCVVCKELGKPDNSEESKQNAPEMNVKNTPPIKNVSVLANPSVTESLETTICILCQRATDASRPEDVKLYMDAVRAGTDALVMLTNPK